MLQGCLARIDRVIACGEGARGRRVRCKDSCLPTLDLLPVLLRLHKLARREEVVKEDRDADLEEDPVDKHLPCAARRASVDSIF